MKQNPCAGDAHNPKNHRTNRIRSYGAEDISAFCVGSRYPKLASDGRPQVIVDDGGVMLIVTMDKPTRSEVEAFGPKGDLELAVGRVDDTLTLTFRFGGREGFSVQTGYSPHIGRPPLLGDLPEGMGYSLHALLLDERGTLLEQRLVGLSTEASRAMRDIFRAILRRPFDLAAYERTAMKLERHYTPYELFRRAACSMRLAGGDLTSRTNEAELERITRRRDDDVEPRFGGDGGQGLEEAAACKTREFLEQVLRRPGPVQHVSAPELAYMARLTDTIANGIPGAYATDLIRDALPDELAPLYAYYSDCGHSILAVPACFEREAEEDVNGPGMHEVTLPVRFVLERGYRVLRGGGHVVVDCDYDKNVGALVPDGYDDF